MQDEVPKSKIEELEKKLYSWEGKVASKKKRSGFDKAEFDVKPEWEHNEEPVVIENTMTEKRNTSPFTKIFLFSVGFFLIAVLFGLYMFFGGSNVVSSQNVDISILGPVSIAGGEELSLDISISNKNSTSLELADLIVEYPEGTKSVADIASDLRRERISLDEVPAGETVRKKFKSILFAEEGTKQQIRVTVEYRVAGSNAIFFKESLYEVTLSSAPVTLTVSSLKEVNSNQDFELTATLVSNSNTTIKNLLLKIDYPFGFTFKEATPKPQYDNSVWDLGDIGPQGKRVIKIKGRIEGQDGEERVFKLSAGVASTQDEKILSTIFLSSSNTIVIRKPFIGIVLSLDGSTSGEYISRAGKTIKADINWANNLPSQVTDAEIQVKFTGDLLDRSSVIVNNGFYQSSNNMIVWDKNSNNELATLNPGDNGVVGFSFATLPLTTVSGASTRNPQIQIEVSVKGRRLSDVQVPEQVSSVVTKIVKLSTDFNLTSRLVHFSGPFTNTGPIPPKADSSTTYTVIWSVTNTANPISNAKVRATLPSYVTLLNVISNPNEKVTFNATNGEVVWDLADVKANVGISGSPREVAFQVSYLASISQVGTIPVIIGESELEGTDNFTGVSLSSIKQLLNTRLNSDPNYSTGQETVVR